MKTWSAPSSSYAAEGRQSAAPHSPLTVRSPLLSDSRARRCPRIRSLRPTCTLKVTSALVTYSGKCPVTSILTAAHFPEIASVGKAA